MPGPKETQVGGVGAIGRAGASVSEQGGGRGQGDRAWVGWG